MKSFLKYYTSILFVGILVGLVSCKQDELTIDLSGQWTFKMDPFDQGVSEKWYNGNFEETILLPGSMKGNGKGYDPELTTSWTGSIYDSSWYYNPDLEKYRSGKPLKFPFWLTPNKYYLGAAWYQKTFTIGQLPENTHLIFTAERPHWHTKLWLDGQEIGNQNSLSVAHRYDLGPGIKPGEHLLTVRVDNRLDEVNVGPDSHSVTDHTQGNWNGMIGEISLKTEPQVYIDDLQVYPDIAQKIAEIRLVVKSENYRGPINIETQGQSLPPAPEKKVPRLRLKKEIGRSIDTFIVLLSMGSEVLLWDEFHPDLYQLTLSIAAGSHSVDTRTIQFGMREIKTSGNQILVNDRPVFLRGNVDCCVFPLTGYPPMDTGSWLKLFSQMKAFGLNHVRFHSWCPPEAAFVAADQLGLYLQPEGPSWANHGTSLGNGRPIDKYIDEETKRIVKAYGNHPSFCMFAYGNEPRGNYVAYLNDWLRYWKATDSRRIYTGASIGGSWQACPENQFHVKGGARGLPWKNKPNSTFDFSRQISVFDEPFVTHELGQYCVYPDFTEIKKYTGYYKAHNFELFRDIAKQNHLDDQAADFLKASGELQKICYKYEIEATLRTPGMAGYQLLGLNDFPGQGTALVGVLNAFYEEKGYCTAEEFTEFCSPVTLLATLPKFVFETNEEFTAGIELANYGLYPLTDQLIHWKIVDESDTAYANGNIKIEHLGCGELVKAGMVVVSLDTIVTARKLTMKAWVDTVQNHWDFWVYPEILPELENNILQASFPDEDVLKHLETGGNVLLMVPGNVENGRDVVQYFTPVFWNTSWFKMRPPHTTGLFVKSEHPVFRDFPTSFHSDLQWWEIVNRQQVMNLENFPAGFKPLIQPIDTWFLNRRLAMLWEARVASGKLMVCSADLLNAGEDYPAARQLLYSIQQYMNSDEFRPKDEIDWPVITELFEKKDRQAVNFYTKNSPDELKPGKK
ncbi:MAG: beta-glucuronidase [Prolixibacteraceae bacterium]|nr:beta-glucuronidase [Prolixibacteraceae bacterium]